MSRKTNPNRHWGPVLKEMRNEAKFSVWALARAMGYPTGGAKVSEIENGKLPVTEELLRRWVAACGKRMTDFYFKASEHEKIIPVKKRH